MLLQSQNAATLGTARSIPTAHVARPSCPALTEPAAPLKIATVLLGAGCTVVRDPATGGGAATGGGITVERRVTVIEGGVPTVGVAVTAIEGGVAAGVGTTATEGEVGGGGAGPLVGITV